MSNRKISIRFFDDREVRAVWDEDNAKWWFSVMDIVALLTRPKRLYENAQLLEIPESKVKERKQSSG